MGDYQVATEGSGESHDVMYYEMSGPEVAQYLQQRRLKGEESGGPKRRVFRVRRDDEGSSLGRSSRLVRRLRVHRKGCAPLDVEGCRHQGVAEVEGDGKVQIEFTDESAVLKKTFMNKDLRHRNQEEQVEFSGESAVLNRKYTNYAFRNMTKEDDIDDNNNEFEDNVDSTMKPRSLMNRLKVELGNSGLLASYLKYEESLSKLNKHSNILTSDTLEDLRDDDMSLDNKKPFLESINGDTNTPIQLLQHSKTPVLDAGANTASSTPPADEVYLDKKFADILKCYIENRGKLKTGTVQNIKGDNNSSNAKDLHITKNTLSHLKSNIEEYLNKEKEQQLEKDNKGNDDFHNSESLVHQLLSELTAYQDRQLHSEKLRKTKSKSSDSKELLAFLLRLCCLTMEQQNKQNKCIEIVAENVSQNHESFDDLLLKLGVGPRTASSAQGKQDVQTNSSTSSDDFFSTKSLGINEQLAKDIHSTISKNLFNSDKNEKRSEPEAPSNKCRMGKSHHTYKRSASKTTKSKTCPKQIRKDKIMEDSDITFEKDIHSEIGETTTWNTSENAKDEMTETFYSIIDYYRQLGDNCVNSKNECSRGNTAVSDIERKPFVKMMLRFIREADSNNDDTQKAEGKTNEKQNTRNKYNEMFTNARKYYEVQKDDCSLYSNAYTVRQNKTHATQVKELLVFLAGERTNILQERSYKQDGSDKHSMFGNKIQGGDRNNECDGTNVRLLEINKLITDQSNRNPNESCKATNWTPENKKQNIFQERFYKQDGSDKHSMFGNKIQGNDRNDECGGIGVRLLELNNLITDQSNRNPNESCKTKNRIPEKKVVADTVTTRRYVDSIKKADGVGNNCSEANSDLLASFVTFLACKDKQYQNTKSTTNKKVNQLENSCDDKISGIVESIKDLILSEKSKCGKTDDDILNSDTIASAIPTDKTVSRDKTQTDTIGNCDEGSCKGAQLKKAGDFVTNQANKVKTRKTKSLPNSENTPLDKENNLFTKGNRKSDKICEDSILSDAVDFFQDKNGTGEQKRENQKSNHNVPDPNREGSQNRKCEESVLSDAVDFFQTKTNNPHETPLQFFDNDENGIKQKNDPTKRPPECREQFANIPKAAKMNLIRQMTPAQLCESIDFLELLPQDFIEVMSYNMAGRVDQEERVKAMITWLEYNYCGRCGHIGPCLQLINAEMIETSQLVELQRQYPHVFCTFEGSVFMIEAFKFHSLNNAKRIAQREESLRMQEQERVLQNRDPTNRPFDRGQRLSRKPSNGDRQDGRRNSFENDVGSVENTHRGSFGLNKGSFDGDQPLIKDSSNAFRQKRESFDRHRRSIEQVNELQSRDESEDLVWRDRSRNRTRSGHRDQGLGQGHRETRHGFRSHDSMDDYSQNNYKKDCKADCFVFSKPVLSANGKYFQL